jgi:AbrB family looped-hinge helix DNA binding protein
MPFTTVTSKGQVVIPVSVRTHYHIEPGAKLFVEERGEEIILKPVSKDHFMRLAGVLKTHGRLSKGLLASRKRDGVHE